MMEKLFIQNGFSEKEHEETIKENESLTIDRTLFPSMYLSIKSSNKT